MARAAAVAATVELAVPAALAAPVAALQARGAPMQTAVLVAWAATPPLAVMAVLVSVVRLV